MHFQQMNLHAACIQRKDSRYSLNKFTNTLPSEECVPKFFSSPLHNKFQAKILHLCQCYPLWVQVLQAGAIAENKMDDTLLLRLQL
jgi:hypothetical protein